jgi:hypothetical protein
MRTRERKLTLRVQYNARAQRRHLKRRRKKNLWLKQRHVFIQAVRTIKRMRRTQGNWYKPISSWVYNTLRLGKERKKTDEFEEYFKSEEEAAANKRSVTRDLLAREKEKGARGMLGGMKSAVSKIAGGIKNMFRRHPK